MAAQLAPAPPPARGHTQPIEATPTDFGTVNETSDFAWTVGLRNTGSEEIEVVRVGTSCDCLQVVPSSFRLPAGGARVDVRLRIDLTRRSPDQVTDEAGRTFQTSLRLACVRDGEPVEHVVHVGGKVRELIAISFGDTNLGEHSILSVPLAPFRLDLQAAGPVVRAIQADVTSPSTWVAHVERGDKSAWRLTATPPQTLAVGPFQVPIALRIDTQDGPSTIKVTLHGRMVDDIELTPGAPTFSPVPVGTTATETLFLRSLTRRPVRIAEVAVSNPACAAEIRGTERDGWSIVLRQPVASAGTHQGHLTLTIVDSEGKQTELRRDYRYFGR